MLLWVTFALLAAAVAAFLLATRLPTPVALHDPDLAIYRDQLGELDADADRGLIDPALADAARAEVARRLLRRASIKAPLSRPPAFSSERILTLAAAAIPVLALGVYLRVGAPSLPGRPLQERIASNPDDAAPADLIAKIEARLREKPEDGQGWSVVAPFYLSQGRALEAAEAYGRAMKLIGETPDRLAGFAKASILANNGIVNDPARKAYERLLTLDPNRIEARFWLAVGTEQDGKSDQAAAAYRSLLAGTPADAPWRKAVEERLAAVTGTSAPSPPGPVPPGQAPAAASPTAGPAPGKGGPSPAEFVAAAQKLPPEMRDLMIGKMVSKSLDAVKSNPKDVAAWSRIVTGHKALGKADEAARVLQEARVAVAGEPSSLAELDTLGKSLDLGS